MPQLTTLRSLCPQIFSGYRGSKHLTPKTSDLTATSVLTKIAAACLIGASTGLGCHYAWTSGAHQGPVLASLLVLCALGLELAKPLSISAAFQTIRSLRLVQGASLALLGAFCVLYSLSAQLSLVATSRGDLVAERTQLSDTSAKASDRYDRAKLELLTLPTTRPKAELDVKIAGLLQTPGADDCKAVNGKVTREVCPQVAELKTQAARADRREKLEATMQEAERDTAKAPAATTADPGATALAAYLALIGLVVDPKLLSNLLVLVGVVALEAGSALSLVLVRAVSPTLMNQPIQEVKAAPDPRLAVEVGHPPVQAGETGDIEETQSERAKVKEAIVAQLVASGGTLSSGSRGLAKKVGAKRATLRRAVNSLVLAGIVAAECSRNGTALRLIG